MHQNEEKVIPASRRPDGTVRKERRVRAGYTPPEEAQVYVPAFRRNRGIGAGAAPRSLQDILQQSSGKQRGKDTKREASGASGSTRAESDLTAIMKGLTIEDKAAKYETISSDEKVQRDSSLRPKCDENSITCQSLSNQTKMNPQGKHIQKDVVERVKRSNDS